MDFHKVCSCFDREGEMSDFLSGVLEGEDGDRPEWRKSLDRCFDTLKKSNRELAMEIDGDVGQIMNAFGDIFFSAGFIVGQAFHAFDLTDPEALEGIKYLRGELKQIIPLWPQEKAPEQSGDEDPGASKQD